jgi:EthD domain
MPQRIQLHLAVRGGLSKAVAGRLDGVTDQLLGSSALRGTGPALAVALVHTPNDPFPAGYPGMRPFDAMVELELRDVSAESPPLIEAVAGLGGELDDLVQCDLSCALVGEPHSIMPTADGGPQPTRYMYVMRRKAGTTHAQYIDYYFNHHKRFGFRAPRHGGYTQFHVDALASQTAARAAGFGLHRVDSVSEFHLESLAAWFAVMAVNADQEAVTVESIADEELFMDRAHSVAYVCDTVAVKGA